MDVDKNKITHKITDELNEEIGIPAIVFNPRKRKKLWYKPKLALTDSKFGGLPYWDTSLPYPTDRNGNKLKLLAQFNLCEISKASGSAMGLLPEAGILQFFLSSGDDYLYGSNLDDYTDDNHFRVVYHPLIKPDIAKDDILKLCIPTYLTSTDDKDPISGETGLDFKIEKVVSPETADFKKRFIEKARKYGWIIDDRSDEVYNDLYDCLGDEIGGELLDSACKEVNCLMGYPVFTQSDPREDDEKYAKYDTQLLQMVSRNDEDKTGYMAAWGDMGIAHFFINHNSLKANDFSDIMYYWDCT